jgi:crossover junction endodeoxyribonuclease RuvC
MVVRILGLDTAPRPADAADALALAICHLWRGGSAVAPASGAVTPAQRQWAEAAAAAARR